MNDQAELLAAIQRANCGMGLPAHFSSETQSTSDDAKEGARRGAVHGSLWCTNFQHHGRGRQGRSWLAIPGQSLLFSLLLRPKHIDPQRMGLWSLAVGIAVQEALLQATVAAPAAEAAQAIKVKWPNDILHHGDKVAGILLESISASASLENLAMVVGIGINLQAPQAADLRASSVEAIWQQQQQQKKKATPSGVLVASTRQPPSRATVLGCTLQRLQVRLGGLFANDSQAYADVIEAFSKVDALQGQPVRRGDHESGIAEGIDRDGHLRVRLATGEIVTWVAGEVHLGQRE